jgi:diacylglycerol kinase family enzyme
MMFIVKYYIAGALLAFIAAYYSPSIYFSILLAWIGVSLAAVSSAYVLQQPSIFRKKSDGSIPLYIRWIFIPFLLGCQLYNAYSRKADKVPPIQQINENLFLACRLFPSDVDFLIKNNVKSILDVTAEFDGLDWTARNEDLAYYNLPVLDHQSPNPNDLVNAVNWIDNHIESNRGVVVHCALGRGRSVLVMAAYLLSKNKATSVTQALSQIQDIRGTAGLNKHQLRKLQRIYESGLLQSAKKLAIIANPVSGGGKWLENREEIVQRLTPHFNLSIYQTTREVGAAELTKQAIQEGAQCIVGCGGDGTVSEVASQVVNTDLEFGILPMGTANALSHALYGANTKIIPSSLACDIIIHGHVMQIDTARCNDELMLMVAGIGLEQKMIEKADRDEKNDGGQMAYIRSLWQAVETNEHQKLIIKLDGQEQKELQTSSLIVANAAPFTTVLAQGGGEPDVKDGVLDVTWLAANNSVSEQVYNLADLAFSGFIQASKGEGFKHIKAHTIEIASAESLKYVIDGENRQSDKIIIKVQPASLNIFSEIY